MICKVKKAPPETGVCSDCEVRGASVRRLVLPLLVGAALCLSGCVTRLAYQKVVDDLRVSQVIVQANATISQLRERLTQLGQFDKNGNLIPLATPTPTPSEKK